MAKVIKFMVFLIVILLVLGSFYYLINLSTTREKITKESYLQVDQFLIKALLKEGSNFTTQLKVMNTGSKGLNIKAEVKNLAFLSVSQSEFYIDYGQTVDLNLEFVTKRGALKQEPGVYVGKLMLTGDDEQIEIPIIVGIESEEILFSINLNIPSESRQITKGTSGLVSVTVYNLKKIGSASVVMSYFVSDMSGNKIVTERESIVVEDKTTFTKVIPIPENILEGSYIFGVSANYGSSTGISSHSFEVIEPIEKRLSFIEKCTNKPYCLTLAIVAIIVIISTVQYIYFMLELSRLIRLKFKKKEEEKHEKYPSILVHGFYNYLASFYRFTRRLRRLLSLKIRESEADLDEDIINIKNDIANEKKIKGYFSDIALELKNKRLHRLEEKKRLLIDKTEKLRKIEELRQEEIRSKKIEEEQRIQDEIRKQKELEAKEKEEERQRILERKIFGEKRKRKVKEFFHNIGLYRTAKERRQRELERQKAEEERRREEELRRQRELESRQREEEIGKKTPEEEQKIQEEIEKLLKRINDWKEQGYDTTILELKIKALEDDELRKLMEQLNDWKSKGYNTLILEEEIYSFYAGGKP